MQTWEVIILGIVQGIAEFLPISSSGHLVILESLLGGDLENLELNITLHFGTLLSILVVFRKDLLPVLSNFKLMTSIVIATLPVVVTGLLLKSKFEAASSHAIYAGFGLLITSMLLFVTPRIDVGERQLSEIRYRDAFVIGLFQAIAPMPGISRSGSTIVGALLMGVKREAAASFSFYIAVPALLGATILTLKDLLEEGSAGTPLTTIAIGTFFAFIVGVAALKLLLKLVAAGKLAMFGFYCLALGSIVIASSMLGWL
ncbi:undecaprenyl-diphosphate phosphatase [Thalassoglobus polymorphus]|uniref:Undecaprenyl-diphosphatase n=1 Tax=Thalassoglobus polymorphus TaxID=2527994 RepID=A0A517QM13_9PLAN|nr:undecaprenyl-diphosphate phosphatase [Thalassoglobus polymorphus]QDT32678.1 Undecaprenyl-diphosphatase [Thalassoglobus polymorphus]